MSDIYKSKTADLTTTGATVIYTVPTADVSTVPPQKPVQAIIKSIRVCNDSGGSVNLTLTLEDASTSGVIKIVNTKAVASNADTELLSAPMVVEDSDVIKAQSSGANALHMILSVLEISA